MREARASAISRMWDRLYQNLAAKASRIGDEGMKKILAKINKIPPDVKEFIIHQYIMACQRKHTIAFL